MIPRTGSGINGFTVITAVPLKSAAIDVQLASDSVVSVYEVFTVGVTGTTSNVDEVDVNGTVIVVVFTPPYGVTAVIVPDHGPVPLSVSVRLVEPPHICAEPTIIPVGRDFKVTVEDPVLSPEFAVQRESLNVAIV